MLRQTSAHAANEVNIIQTIRFQSEINTAYRYMSIAAFRDILDKTAHDTSDSLAIYTQDLAVMDTVCVIKANIYAISSDTHQLQFIKLHHFKQERF